MVGTVVSSMILRTIQIAYVGSRRMSLFGTTLQYVPQSPSSLLHDSIYLTEIIDCLADVPKKKPKLNL